MSLSIKKLTNNQLEFAKNLWLLWQADDGYENPSLPPDGYLLKLLCRDDFHVLAAFDGDKVVGGLTAYDMVMYQQQETELFIYEVGVERQHRQRGIARSLINEMRRLALEKGITVMYVGAEMPNAAARQLYSTTGGRFEEVAWYTYESTN
nr:GNAT family N-acetyltransferase [uncultured Mucilaginibacter sp.]